jgi:hypothetical protein
MRGLGESNGGKTVSPFFAQQLVVQRVQINRSYSDQFKDSTISIDNSSKSSSNLVSRLYLHWGSNSDWKKCPVLTVAGLKYMQYCSYCLTSLQPPNFIWYGVVVEGG